MRHRVLAAAVAFLLVGCGGADPAAEAPAPAAPALPPMEEPAPVPAGRAPPPGPYAPGVDALHYAIELGIPAATDTIRGRARIRLVRTDAGTDTVRFDLTGLAVDTVRIGPAVAGRPGTLVEPAVYREALADGKLPVPLPGGSSAGDTLEVDVAYRGVPDDGLILGRTVHDAPSAFADNWPNRGRFWFPSIDHPSDKATVAFTVHAPAEWDVVANGVLVGPPTSTSPGAPGGAAGKRTWRWRSRTPIPTYTMVVGGTEMRIRRVGLAACGEAPESPRRDGCVEVTTWLYPQDTARAAPSFRRSPEMVDVFTEIVGPFPYEKLANVQSSTRFGGMENATAIFYSERALASGRDIEGTVAHEIAHQWFGDAVTEADWHHLWLSEGFATYFAAVFFERADGARAFRAEMEENRVRYLSSEASDRPIVDPDQDDLFDLLNANNYQKGAWVLHTLRGVLGDDAFFRGIREFYRRHRHGTALTEDLRRAMEEASERELGWFFEQWVFRPGHPVVATEWSWDPDGGEARITLRQEQREGWSVFRAPAVVAVRLTDGTERRREVELAGRTTELTLSLPSRPDTVVFDPDGRVLHRKAAETLPPG